MCRAVSPNTKPSKISPSISEIIRNLQTQFDKNEGENAIISMSVSN